MTIQGLTSPGPDLSRKVPQARPAMSKQSDRQEVKAVCVMAAAARGHTEQTQRAQERLPAAWDGYSTDGA